jgi:hypothetical protein
MNALMAFVVVKGKYFLFNNFISSVLTQILSLTDTGDVAAAATLLLSPIRHTHSNHLPPYLITRHLTPPPAASHHAATRIPAWGSIPPLARAAVCEIPFMEEPDFDVLHTLVRLFYCFINLRKRKLMFSKFFMIWYFT